jgi:hypothetical protein
MMMMMFMPCHDSSPLNDDKTVRKISSSVYDKHTPHLTQTRR